MILLETKWPTAVELTRYLEKVQPVDDCLLWIGGVSKGYGMFTLGFGRFKGVSYAVHRLSYSWFNGPIPQYYEVHHNCERRLCIKPRHLEAINKPQHMALERANGNWGNQNTVKTHCTAGHEFTDENTYWFRGSRPPHNLHRQCKCCAKLRYERSLIC